MDTANDVIPSTPTSRRVHIADSSVVGPSAVHSGSFIARPAVATNPNAFSTHIEIIHAWYSIKRSDADYANGFTYVNNSTDAIATTAGQEQPIHKKKKVELRPGVPIRMSKYY